MRTMTVKPSQLRVRPKPDSPTGYSLFVQPEHERNDSAASADLAWQEVSQCSLELFQEELADLNPLVLRQLSTCCVNDLRNILLIHDKRILCIIREELASLVARQVLTEQEGQLLKNGIVETLVPGSLSMKELL